MSLAQLGPSLLRYILAFGAFLWKLESMFIYIGHKGVITDHVEKNQNNLENSPIFWEVGKKCERKKD